MKKIMNRIKSKFNKHNDFKKKYKELKKEYDKEVDMNNKLLIKITNLEYLLDLDNQIQKIEQLETVIDKYRQEKHQMRYEILDLRKKLNK